MASQLVHGIDYSGWAGLITASLLLGVLNAVLRPVILILSFPLLILTFGLFIPIVNALLLQVVGSVVKGFHVAGFWAAFWGGIVVSLVSLFANAVIGKPEKRGAAAAPPPRSSPPPPPPGQGPIIDV